MEKRPTSRHQARATRILATATDLMAASGRYGISFTGLAKHLGIAYGTLKRHHAGLHHLLAAILTQHLCVIEAALAATKPGAPSRAAYLAVTRAPENAAAQLLWRRDRHLLPPDLLAPIEALRHRIGAHVAGPQGNIALDLLDNPILDAPRINSMLAALPAASRKPTPRPAKPIPAPAPRPRRSTRVRFNTLIAAIAMADQLVTPPPALIKQLHKQAPPPPPEQSYVRRKEAVLF